MDASISFFFFSRLQVRNTGINVCLCSCVCVCARVCVYVCVRVHLKINHVHAYVNINE